tara:strand:- start:242 stop:430 length:189 start_codon:yes stop_codon:yes gene_type:complete
MRVGDLVKIVQSAIDPLKTPFLEQVGVIIRKTTLESEQNDWYDVLTRDSIRSFRADYLEEIK